MKINAIKQYNPNNNKANSSKNQSFKASMNVLRDVTDVVSDLTVDMSEPFFNRVLNYIEPKIKNLSDNYHFDVSGTRSPVNFWSLFNKPKFGLKFDLTVIDPARLKWEILNSKIKSSRLKMETLRDFNLNTPGIAEVLSLPRKFGKLYDPALQTEPEYCKSLYKQILTEIEYLPHNQLESSYGYKDKRIDTYVRSTDCFKNGRSKFDCYAGIEY